MKTYLLLFAVVLVLAFAASHQYWRVNEFAELNKISKMKAFFILN